MSMQKKDGVTELSKAVADAVLKYEIEVSAEREAREVHAHVKHRLESARQELEKSKGALDAAVAEVLKP